ncbi:MAG: DUF4160 domain-containing protein [Longimicrobiales bacterium]
MYALVLETDGFEFLIDPAELWKPPRVLVRRGWNEAEVWLDEEVEVRKPGRFSRQDEARILGLVSTHLEDLLNCWFRLKDDVRRDRLDRNHLVE